MALHPAAARYVPRPYPGHDHLRGIPQTGSLYASITLVKTGGGMEVFLLDGPATNSARAKAKLGQTIRARIAAGGIEAAILKTDSFVSRMSPEENKMRKLLGLTVEQAGKAGICKVAEMATVTLESPRFHQVSWQEYRRRDGVIELVGDPDVQDDAGPNPLLVSSARLTGFFPQA